MTLRMKPTSLCLVTAVLVSTTLAQSPFQPPQDADFRRSSHPQGRSSHPNRHNQRADNLVRQNPFTPPSIDRQQTTRRVVTTPPSRYIAVAQPEVHTPAPRVGSPFTPPTNQEWRDDNIIPQAPRRFQDLPSRKQRKPEKDSSWLDALEERQRENAESIPSISNVQVPSSTPRRRRRYRGNKPRASVYQEDIKDMHDTRPGVTPWTRYTEKPRVHGDDGEDTESTRKGVARCGHLRYSPRSQICCGGQVVRRHGVSPACCGKKAYDNVFNKCCKGVVSTRVLGEADSTDC